MEATREGITYDYKTIRVKRNMETMASDAYESLGWQPVNSSIAEGFIFNVNLSFKRDRKIEDKQKLLKLQEKVDSTLSNIETLQDRKRSAGTTPALSVGVAGALVLGGGMSMVMLLGGALGFMIGGIALGIVGMGICALAMPVYKKTKKKQFAEIESALENEFNKLADICEEAR